MLQTRTKKLVIIFGCLCVLLAMSFTIPAIRNLRNAPTEATEKEREQLASTSQNTGIMSKQDYLKREQVISEIKKNDHSISNADLNWTLQMLKTPAPSGDALVQSVRRLDMMLVLKRVDKYTPDQEAEVYPTVIGFISSNVLSDRLGAIAVLRGLKDVKAIPNLTLLTNDSNPAVQQQARRAIKQINEQTSGSSS